MSRSADARRLLHALPTNQQAGICLILGGSDSVWDDISALETLVPNAQWTDYETPRPCTACKKTAHRVPMNWPGPVIVVNDIGVHFPGRIDHWVSIHAEKFKGLVQNQGKWKEKRAANGYPASYLTWGKLTKDKAKARLVDRMVKTWIGGSSGMFAATVAKDGLHCEKAILCGVGMEQTPHFVDSDEHSYNKKWQSATTHWRNWQNKVTKQRHLEVWLRSMSGNTRDLLGGPSPEWLAGKPEKKKAA